MRLRLFSPLLLAVFIAARPALLAADEPSPSPSPKPMALPPGFPSPEERKRLGELAAADLKVMRAELHLAEPPLLPAPADDPRRPPHTQPVPNSFNWTDGVLGHTIVRSGWGNWSNYDLAKAERYPLPAVLTLKDGTVVDDAATWWQRRRLEILADFQTEIYGVIPAQTPNVTWAVTRVEPGAVGGAAIRKDVLGTIDNSSYPAAKPRIAVALYLPAKAQGPVPVIVIASWSTSPGGFGPPPKGPTALEQVIAHGWGYALVDTYGIQADSGGGLDAGVIGLVNRGAPRRPSDWGALAAWSWGLSRVIDYLETDPAVDGRRLGIEGHSRWGKEALLSAALDSRWAIVYSSCAGEGGSKLHRHDVGESVDNVCSSGEYHWMAGNFLKYGGHWDQLPVDQHELIALVAPRPVFITGGTQDLWSDPVGEFEACVAAGPVYQLLGKRPLGTTRLPAPNIGLTDGDLAYRLHEGGHTDLPDWPAFLEFADRYFGSATVLRP